MDNDSKRILLFDIDGTLLDPAGVGRVCFQRALQDVLGVEGSLEGLKLAGRTDWQILEDMIEHAGHLKKSEDECHLDFSFRTLDPAPAGDSCKSGGDNYTERRKAA